MCLDRIRPDMNRFEKGWKIFDSDRGKLYTLICGNSTKPLPINKWLHYKKWAVSKNNLICSLESEEGGIQKYPQGWHVEASKTDAKRWINYKYKDILRKVLCRDMHTVGRQDGAKVGVCRYIKILPEGSK